MLRLKVEWETASDSICTRHDAQAARSMAQAGRSSPGLDFSSLLRMT
jgi:hypothetical protein